MPFKPKKDATTGQFAWAEDKPIFINLETAAEITVDVDQLFTKVTQLTGEAQRNRETADAAQKERDQFKSKLDGFGDLQATDVKAKLEELVQLKANPSTKKPSDQEMDDLVAEKYKAAMTNSTALLEAMTGDRDKIEKERDTAIAEHRILFLENQIDHDLDLVKGFNPLCRDDARRLLREEFVVENAQSPEGAPLKGLMAVMKGGDGRNVPGSDPTKTLWLTPLERINALVRNDKRHWLTPSTGTPPVETGGGGDAGPVDVSKVTTSSLFDAALETPIMPAGGAA